MIIVDQVLFTKVGSTERPRAKIAKTISSIERPACYKVL